MKFPKTTLVITSIVANTVLLEYTATTFGAILHIVHTNLHYVESIQLFSVSDFDTQQL